LRRRFLRGCNATDEQACNHRATHARR
jgi:hypothetical protein